MRSIAIPVGVCTLAAFGQGWVQLADFPGTARDDAAAFSIGTKVYVGTGREVGFGLTNDWHAFDVIGNSWAPVSALPASGRQYCAAFTIGDKGYLFGGMDDGGPLNELWEYDPASDAWTQRASLPATGRHACAAFATSAGYITTGILDGASPTVETWRYDPNTDLWAQVASFPGVARHRATGLIAQIPIVVGGADEQAVALADGYKYDEQLDAWTPIAPLPAARFWSSSAEYLVVGGATSFVQEHDDAWLYENFADNWTSVTVPPFAGGPRRGGVAAQVTFFGLTGWFYGLGAHASDRYRDWWKLSLPVGIHEYPDDLPQVLPNPAHEHLMIQPPGHWGSMAYTIHDGLGRMVLEGRATGGTTIDIAALRPGRYIIVLTHRDRPYQVSFIKLP